MFALDRIPDLESPDYTLLSRRADYEARDGAESCAPSLSLIARAPLRYLPPSSLRCFRRLCSHCCHALLWLGVCRPLT